MTPKFIPACAFALFASAALAQPDDRTTCERSSGAPAIAACTRAISSGMFTGLELVKLRALAKN